MNLAFSYANLSLCKVSVNMINIYCIAGIENKEYL